MSAAGSRASTDAVLQQWQQWLDNATDRLMDVDARSASGDDRVRLDIAAAFVCRKAIAARVDAMRANGGDASRLSEQPVVDDQGDRVGDDLPQAAQLLTAVLERVESALAAHETSAHQLASDAMSADADLAVAERLAVDLGQYVQRVAGVRAQVDAAGRAPAALHAAAAAAHDVRDELEAMAVDRDRLLERWSAIGSTIEQLRNRERDVRLVVERCREKVRPLPVLAVPSVDAIGVPASLDELRAMPWPAARAAMQPVLDRVGRLDDAFEQVELRFAAVLAQRDDLRGLLQSFRDKAGGSGLAEHPDLEPMFRTAERELWSAPCDVERAQGLVAEYTAAVNRMIAERGAR
jgi:hypothetical protein